MPHKEKGSQQHTESQQKTTDAQRHNSGYRNNFKWTGETKSACPLDDILARLHRVAKNGKGYTACCPAHDDSNPSLSLSVADNGSILLKCYAGCSLDNILAALDLRLSDLFPQKSRKIVATYDYRDEQNKLLFQVVRYEPKGFAQRKPDENGGWIYNLKDTRRVLYRLSNIIMADTVYVVEGEKDADRLWSLGLPATTNPQGAGKWRDEYNSFLAGKRVVILPDNDEPGEQHALQLARSLLSVAVSVQIVRLPELPPKGDVSDWINAGHTKEELARLVKETPVLKSEDFRAEQDEEHDASVQQQTEAAQPFPTHVLPPVVSEFVREVAKSLHCQEDYVAVPALVAIGALVGNSCEIELKPGWKEGANLYAMIIGEPGQKKSPAMHKAVAPVYQLQRNLYKDYQKEKAEYQRKLDEYEVESVRWKKRVNKNTADASDKPQEPILPSFRELYTTDSTIEALATCLSANQDGVAYLADEISGWVLAFNQYKGGKGADKQHWLSFYHRGNVKINRKNLKEPILLDTPFVAVCGGIQPDVLPELSDERGREDGFIHRILPSYPEKMPLAPSDHIVRREIEASYADLFSTLYLFREQGPVTCALQRSASQRWKAFQVAHYAEQADPDFSPVLAGAWAKLEAYCARLALILHVAHAASAGANPGNVTERIIDDACRIIDYFKSHTRRVYAQLRTTPEDKRAEAAVDWIRAHGGSASARALLRHHVANLKKASEAKELLKSLVDRGYGSLSTKGKSEIFILS